MTNMKKKMKKTCRKNVKWMAAAALTAALLSGQVMPAVAAGSSTVVEVSSIFPENITIESPVPLSEISLPKSEYGKLSWADDSLVPSKRSEAFEVVFRPSESFDLSRIDGWDGESEKITGYVTVVVSSIAQPAEEDYTGYEEPADIAPETGEESAVQEAEAPNPEEAAEPEAVPEESGTAENSGNDQQETELTPDADGEGETQEISDEETAPNVNDEEISSEVPGEETDDETASESEEADQDKEQPSETDESGEGTDDAGEVDDGLAGEPDVSENPDVTENPEDQENPDDQANPDITEAPDNIFDREEEVKDERPVTAEENLTEEEMQQCAVENHSCDGISVSGINLPWYVQFRATSGESYEFTNESSASIFRSYEFELWDLKNNTEYEIPDGEYISVTIPVKEGYEYTIEHLLDNGATETIIPSVEGSTMVFSTHSFSPFGIAGSKPLVGGNVAENTYLTPTPTAVPTKAPAGTTANDPSNNHTNTNNTNTNSNTGSNPAGGNTEIQNSAGTDNSSSGTGSSGSGDTNSSSLSSTSSQGQNSTSTKAVKTGDDTRILPFVILVAAAVVIIAAVLFLKRKKK
ncbi:MAG: hypothetical protein Q4C77_09165 [Eubacteriales bacterium]|nr:hypothetical protein [Eubacteriales bacterium]